MDFTSIESAMYGDVENDEELLAELYALEADERRGAAARRPAAAPAPAPAPAAGPSRRPPVAGRSAAAGGASTLTPKMLADAMADIPDDDSMDDDAEIEDDDLLEELSNLVEEEGGGKAAAAPASRIPTSAAPSDIDTSLLQRLQQLSSEYKIALEKAAGNASKMRRYQRALSKLEELCKNVRMGKAVDESDIPVSLGLSAAPKSAPSDLPPPIPARVAAPESSKSSSFSVRAAPPPPLPSRRSEVSERSSSTTTSSEGSITTGPYSRAVDEDCVAPSASSSSSTVFPENASSGKTLNVEQITKLLTRRREAFVQNAQLANTAGDKKSAYEYYTVAKQFDEALAAVKSGQVTECEESDLPPSPVPFKAQKKFVIPAAPKTVLEGLQQRMEKYKEICEQAKQENNDRKLRMNSRIVKQYEEAVKMYRSKRPVDLNELPCPPGYPPFPVEKAAASDSAQPRPRAAVHPSGVASAVEGKPRQAPQVGPLAPALPPSGGQKPQSRQSQQLQFLLKRQLQFKQAALAAKQKNDLALARKYLTAAKGFDSMIEASRAGIPVDIRNAPIPPQVQTAQQSLKPALASREIADPSVVIEGGRDEMFAALEKDLIRQIKLCDENRIAFTKLGDVSRVKLFEDWEENSKADLLVLRQRAKIGSAVPKFRYESRSIPSVDVCADVNEDHMELSIVRVLNAKLPSGWQPSDGNLYVKYEFAFPHESHQSGKTKLVAGTNSPDFNEKVLLMINRKSKQLLRVVKRNCLKFEVYQKGGFLRSDRLLGSVDFKLAALEEKSVLHESADLMEGRKPAGGKIEFKVRVREPLGGNRLNIVKERWLVFEM